MSAEKIQLSTPDGGNGSGFTNKRRAPRIQLTGTAHIHVPQQQSQRGRIHDLTSDGVSIFLDLQLRINLSCTLQLAIYHKGTSYQVEVQARCVNAMLVGGRGFRHGFQFYAVDPGALEKLNRICGG